MEMGANLTGDLTSGLDKMVADVDSGVLISGAAAMARVFYEEARTNALRHYKKGELFNAIYRVYAKDRSSDDRAVYQVSWNHIRAPHGHLIEWGTSHSPAFPFIRPAFDRAQDAIDAGLNRMRERYEELSKGGA